jgi:hypothetical protein
MERARRIPAANIVRRDWQSGMSPAAMAERYGVPETSVERYLRPRIKGWQVPAGGGRTGKIVCRVSVFTVQGYWREVPVSLPLLAMHEKAMHSRLATFRVHFLDPRIPFLDVDAIDAANAKAFAAQRRRLPLDAVRKCSRLIQMEDSTDARRFDPDGKADARSRADAGPGAEWSGTAEAERLCRAPIPAR